MTPAATRSLAKRVYEEPQDSDGIRVLVDRLWPRGLTKDQARVDAWLRDLAPSNELRKWFHAHSEKRAEFRKRYLGELKRPIAARAFEQLDELLAAGRRATLLFASKNAEYNNATVLRKLIEEKSLKRKQPARARQRSLRGSKEIAI